MVLDIYDDGGLYLKKLFPTVNSLPAVIREGGPILSREKLASDQFALQFPYRDGIRTAYPINTPAAAATSFLYFENYHTYLEPSLQKTAAANIKEALDSFGIDIPEDSATYKLASVYHTEESQSTKLAKFAKGIREKLADTGVSPLQLKTPQHVKLAVHLYDRIIPRLSPEQRREFSLELLDKCAEYGVEPPESIEKWAGNQVSLVRLIDAVEKRASFMPDKSQLLHKLVQKAQELPVEKLASLLHEVDKLAKLEQHYDRRIPDPYSIHEFANPEPKMYKLAEFEIPQEHWKAAVDAGLLEPFEPQVKATLARNPEMLNQYVDTPVFDYIVNGLKSMGIIEEEEKQAGFDPLGLGTLRR